MRFVRAAPARASRAGAAAAASPWIQTSARRLAEGRSELIRPLAPPLFFVRVELARAFLGSAVLRPVAFRPNPDHKPDEDNKQDRGKDDIDHPGCSVSHAILPPGFEGTPG